MENSNHEPEEPIASGDPRALYLGKRAACEVQRTQFAEARTRLGYALGAVVMVVLWIGLSAARGYTGAVLAAGLSAIVALLVLYLRAGMKTSRIDRLLALYDRNLRRVEGVETQSGATGEALRPASHLYERDLNLLGADSLFGLLDTVRTGIGQRGLADYLLLAASRDESHARQQAVRELAANLALRERIHLLGTSRFQQVDASFFDRWLADPAPEFPVWLSPVLVLTSASLLAMLVLGLTHIFAWPALLPKLLAVAALQSALALWVRPRVLPVLEAVARLSNHVQMFSDGLGLIISEPLVCAKLMQIKATAAQPADAVGLLKQLQSQVNLVQQRTKEYFFLFSLLLAAGTQAAISISRWKQKNGAAMTLWLAAWAEFEALNALAQYAFEHPADAWPELLTDGHPPMFEAAALAHPLLANGVRNDVALGGSPAAARRFYLISGSNMSGKSTLMRTIGVNAVLAYAGAPVRASSMRLTPLRIGPSLALTDSLAEGKSKFLAEVERLQQIVRQSEQVPVLFLVDEIFSGTNSVDRLAAAGAVLRRLLANRAIGALSTHDLTLAELAGDGSGGTNVHMASPDADDPLGFDYRLKQGFNTSSNALAIIRMMGLSQADEVLPANAGERGPDAKTSS